MCVGIVELSEHAKRARRERRECQSGGVSHTFQSTKCPKMDDGVRVVAKRHQHAHDGLQMQARCHATDLRMNTSQGSGTAGSGIRLSVLNDCIDKPIDLRVRESVSSTVAEASQCLYTNGSNNRIGIDNEFLQNIMLASKMSFRALM